MLKLEDLQRSFGHLTNEMLEGLIEWWQLPPEKYEKDLILPRLLEERLNRMELDYEIYNEGRSTRKWTKVRRA